MSYPAFLFIGLVSVIEKGEGRVRGCVSSARLWVNVLTVFYAMKEKCFCFFFGGGGGGDLPFSHDVDVLVKLITIVIAIVQRPLAKRF